MVLKNIEADAEHRHLLHEASTRAPVVGERERDAPPRGLHLPVRARLDTRPNDRSASCSRSAAPRRWWWAASPTRARAAELERQVAGGHRNMEAMSPTRKVRPPARRGIYVPVCALPLDRAAADVSISLSITWRTAHRHRRARARRQRRARSLGCLRRCPDGGRAPTA
jgi:hypothetical protein